MQTTSSLTTLRLTHGQMLAVFLLIGLGLLPAEVWAGAPAAPFANLTNFVTTFRTAIQGISVVVVTLAIAFSGYQIAFNNKRVGDVAPVLIGGVIVGLAGALAGVIGVL